MTRYRMTFKCADCKNVFKQITSNSNLQSAPCPKCRRAKMKASKPPIKFMRVGDGPVTDADLLAEKIAKKLMKTPEFQASLASKLLSPTPQAAQNRIKAVDTTADIVMQDYKIGDLPDHGMRVGDTMTPKLPPAQQAKADNFFGGGKKSGLPFNSRQVAAMINSGGLRPEANGAMNPVAQMHRNRTKPATQIIASTDGKH